MSVQIQSSLFFETPAEIFARVFRTLCPRKDVPEVRVSFRAFASATSRIQWKDGRLEVKITDLLQEAPAPIVEALAYLLIGKLTLQPVPEIYQGMHRRYLHRSEVQERLQTLRRQRGRKFLTGPRGRVYDLAVLFADLNGEYFAGGLTVPILSWSRRPSRTLLGHYDAAHQAVVLSRWLDREEVPLLAVRYVLFHEMLHMVHPVEHQPTRRCVHTPAFKRAEREFAQWKEARALLKRL